MPTLTLQDLTNRVLARLDNNTLLYPAGEVNRAINEAYRVVNLLTGFQITSIPVPGWSQPNRIWYTVPPGIIIPTRISYENAYLQPTTLNAIGRGNPTWSSETTANTGMPVTSWFRLGLGTFGIHPADANGGGQLVVTGLQEPNLLISPLDTVNWNANFLAAFDAYAVHTLQLKESSAIFAQASTDYQELMRIVKRMGYWRSFVAPKYWLEATQQQNR